MKPSDVSREGWKRSLKANNTAYIFLKAMEPRLWDKRHQLKLVTDELYEAMQYAEYWFIPEVVNPEGEEINGNHKQSI